MRRGFEEPEFLARWARSGSSRPTPRRERLDSLA